MFRTLKTLLGRDPDTDLILCLKLYCDQLFGAALPQVDLKALMHEAESAPPPEFAALRLVLGLYVVDLVANTSSILPLDDRSAVAALYYLYSDQFGLEGEDAEALREPVVALKEPALERLEQGGEDAELDIWPDRTALGIIYLAGLSAERICDEYRTNPKREIAPTDEEIDNFKAMCSDALTAAAADQEEPPG